VRDLVETHVGFFLVALAVGAALIAVWLDVRFERFGPSDFRGAFLHVGLALVVGWLLVPAGLAGVLAVGASPTVALLGVALPSLVYVFLAALWVVKQAQGLLLRR
jgi:hypothetical protein